MQATDEQLMQNYANGDISAFEVLYHQHRAALFRYILRQVSGHQATAEEIFQDVWSSVISARKQYQPTARFSTWLYTLAHNRTVDHFRRNAVRLVEPSDEDVDEISGSATGPDSQLNMDNCIELLLSLVQSLPHEQRNVFVLRQEFNHTLEEIADITSSTFEAVKSRLRYAVRKLRDPLEQEDCL